MENTGIRMTFEEFKREWMKHFAGDVSAEKIEKYVLCHGYAWNFIWHVFSWRLLPDGDYLEGNPARRAFDQADKEGAVAVQYPFDDNPACILLPTVWCSAKSLKKVSEIYVAGKDFAWTYIKTHEIDCGPYFCMCRTDSAENYDRAVAQHALNEQ